jgi:hypothetical protein
MKTLIIVVGNSNNYIGNSILSGKSEAVESGFEFMKSSVSKLYFHGYDIQIGPGSLTLEIFLFIF